MNKELRVGVIVKTHGIRGEVKVYPTTDSPDRFDEVREIILKQNNHTRYLEVEKARYFRNLVILKFKGIDSINDVEAFRGAELYVDRKYGVPLEEGEYYIADIIGLKVITDDGNELGTVRDVLETGANDVYIVDAPSGKEILLPAIRQCILNVDLTQDIMTVHLLEGLLDL